MHLKLEILESEWGSNPLSSLKLKAYNLDYGKFRSWPYLKCFIEHDKSNNESLLTFVINLIRYLYFSLIIFAINQIKVFALTLAGIDHPLIKFH